jgi:NADPH:quinone reductase-like Zn-dependent oxidoreductase
VLGGVDGVLELVGPSVFADSLRACTPGGIVCATGALGATPHDADKQRLGYLLEHVELTEFNVADLDRTRIGNGLQALVDEVAAGRLLPILDRVFAFDDLVEAHRLMDASGACGKLVVAMP